MSWQGNKHKYKLEIGDKEFLIRENTNIDFIKHNNNNKSKSISNPEYPVYYGIGGYGMELSMLVVENEQIKHEKLISIIYYYSTAVTQIQC